MVNKAVIVVIIKQEKRFMLLCSCFDDLRKASHPFGQPASDGQGKGRV